jgi:8-oxo-dGTP diphosphatase
MNNGTQYVVGFMFSPGLSGVVLTLKNRPAWQVGLLNGPGGKVNVGETHKRAMVREFHEEAGYFSSEHDWELCAVLRPSPTKLASGMPWAEVRFYSTISDQAFSIDHQHRGEYTRWHQIRNIRRGDFVPNLPLLIEIARDRSGISWPIYLSDDCIAT